jgi:hypothetical protein
VATPEGVVRKLIFFLALFLGTVALSVGVVGLLAPVSVSPEDKTVRCGSALAPDLSAARAEDDHSAVNIPVLADTNFTRLCQMDLKDRRMWTISLAAVGALAILGSLAFRARSARAPSPQ